MGLGQRKSKGSKGGHKTKNKEYKKGHATKNRRKDIDQIQDELKEEEEKGEETTFDVDDDLPGQGQFYCTPCARHFTDQKTKTVHVKSKLHKRRMKDVAQEQYTQAEAERGAGMSKEKYPPAHPVKGAPAPSAAPAPGATKESRVESWAVPGGASGVGGVGVATAAKAKQRGEVAGSGDGGGVSSVSVSMEEEDPDL